MMRLFEEELSGDAGRFARLVRNREELDECLAVRANDPNFRVAVVHALEGGHVLGGEPASLEEFARLGVAMITVTHFFNKGLASSANSFPFFPDTESIPPSQGLSEIGREVVAEMNRLGIIVDVSHMTAAAIADVLAITSTSQPLVASHSTVRTLGDHASAIPEELIQEIARRGGLFGVILYPHQLSNYASRGLAIEHGSMRDVVRTVAHVAKVCGTHESVAIGSDYGGVTSGPKEMPTLDDLEPLRVALHSEFGGDDAVVEGIMAANTIAFLRANWRSGAAG
jgi:membrane dipeptidase